MNLKGVYSTDRNDETSGVYSEGTRYLPSLQVQYQASYIQLEGKRKANYRKMMMHFFIHCNFIILCRNNSRLSHLKVYVKVFCLKKNGKLQR